MPIARPVLLVHGAWHGGWCWDLLRPLLEREGYSVHAPTLPGLGEGDDPRAGLSSHVEAIIRIISDQGFEDAILVGHSYGGFPAATAAQHLGAQVADLILLDAFMPKDGERVVDHAPELDAKWGARLAADPDWMIPPASPASFGLAGELADWVGARLRPHPPRTYFDPVSMPVRKAPLRKAYIRCTAPMSRLLDRSVERIRSEGGWAYKEISACHDVMIENPRLLADTLIAVAEA